MHQEDPRNDVGANDDGKTHDSDELKRFMYRLEASE